MLALKRSLVPAARTHNIRVFSRQHSTSWSVPGLENRMPDEGMALSPILTASD